MCRQLAYLLLSFMTCLPLLRQASAMPDPPGSAVVAVARAERILVPPGVFAPKLLYPKGRVEFGIVEKLVDQALTSLTGQEEADEAWRRFVSPVDRVGIMVDALAPAVQTATVEVVIDRLVDAGVKPDNICVFGTDERNLFNAGFTVSHEGPGVRTYGADSEGYRGGMSRIVTGNIDVLINVATLKTDPEIGLAGCVANALACVPEVERRRLRMETYRLGSVAAHPAIRMKTKLNLLEAYLPVVEPHPRDPVTVEYRGLLAGTDPVAVDVIGLRVLQACRDTYHQAPWPITPEVTYLRSAQMEYRLGQAELEQIDIKLSGPTEGAYLP